MRLLEAFASAFINTFGITQPSEAQRRRAAWVIACMLALALVAVGVVGGAIYLAMRH